MYISSNEIKFHIKKRGVNVDFNPIGSRLKFKRRSLNLTLEEGAEDICSVSYLSKVENNLIAPTDKYIDLLKEKYQMDYELKDQEIYENELDHLIQLFFKDEEYDNSYQKEYYEDYQEFMIQYAKLVMSNQYVKAQEMFPDMLLFIPNLPMKSLNFLLALTSKILYQDLRYSDSKEIIKLMNLEQETNEYMIMIKHKWLIKNALKLYQVLVFESIYVIYKEELIKHACFDEMMALEFERKTLYQTIAAIDQIEHNDKESHMKQLIVKQQYEAFKYHEVVQLTQHELLNLDLLVYYLLALDHLNETETIKNIVKNITIHKNEHKKAWLIVRHLTFKYLHQKEDQLSYLRNEILGFHHLTDEISLLYYLTMDTFKQFQKYHFYKEATETIDKYLPMMRQLNRT